MQATLPIQRGFVACTLHVIALAIACLSTGSCHDKTPKKPSSLCSQAIPGSGLLLFEFTFAGEWATTSDSWGYAISDSAEKIGKHDQEQLPKGRLFKVTPGGVVHLASFAPYDPSVGERTIRHVIRGVSIIETIFNSDGNGWWLGGNYSFEGIEAAGDRIAFTTVKDEHGTLLHDRLEVDAGGLVARGSGGLVKSLELYRVEPNSSASPATTKHRFFYDTYSPATAVRSDQLPARGICK